MHYIEPVKKDERIPFEDDVKIQKTPRSSKRQLFWPLRVRNKEQSEQIIKYVISKQEHLEVRQTT